MIKADAFLDAAAAAGYEFYTGVPCSFLTPMINRVITRDDLTYVPAASEGEAPPESYAVQVGAKIHFSICFVTKIALKV